jgi:YVTN family beta-propeller protein
MRKNIIMLVALFAGSIYFPSCSKDQIVTTNTNNCNITLPDSGVYILSEGGFSPNTSKLSYYSPSHDSLYSSIFCPGNLGLTPDGILISGQNIFLTEQGTFGSAGKIYKLNLNGNVLNSQAAGINPYSLAIANNKIYVTNGPASKVTILDMNSLSLIKTVSVGVYPQEIIALNNKVFVCNTSAFGGAADSTVSVIDAVSDNVISTITVRKDPSSLVVTNEGRLLIGCPLPASLIYIVNPAAFLKEDSIYVSVNSDGFGKDIAVDRSSNLIYYLSYTNGTVLKTDLVTKISGSFIGAIAGDYPYGYNYDNITRKHYVLDAGNFSSNGGVQIFNSAGAHEKSLAVGIAPRRVIFRVN